MQDTQDKATAKANFRAARERVGLTQDALAHAIKVNARTIKRWEREDNTWAAPADACETLTRMLEIQRAMVAAAVSHVDQDNPPALASLAYYRDQTMFEKFGPVDERGGWYGVANANARAIAQAMEALGVRVEFRYPCE
jgi:DNA-binding XRE family transcriptional regulator